MKVGEFMPYTAPSVCPVCGAAMQVTKLSCPACQSELAGRFAPCKFCALPEKELQFIEVFLRCRGSIKDVEKALGVSYPTVRGMLDGALKALGFAEEAPPESNAEGRREVLAMLEKGEIDAREAAKRLAGMGRESK